MYAYCTRNPRGWCRLVGMAYVGRGGRAARAAAVGHGQSVRAGRAVPRAEQPALYGALEPRRCYLSGARTLTTCTFMPFTFENVSLSYVACRDAFF